MFSLTRSLPTLLRRNWPIAAVLLMSLTTAVTAQEFAAKIRSTSASRNPPLRNLR